MRTKLFEKVRSLQQLHALEDFGDAVPGVKWLGSV